MMDYKTQIEIEQFLYKEVYYLDHRKYKEWLTMLTDDIIYKMPMRITVENKRKNIHKDMKYFEDTRKDLEMKVERLYTKFAWVDNPAPRQRHFISNVVIDSIVNGDEYYVTSYFHFKRSRSDDPETEEMFGERKDKIVRENGELKLAERTIYPDQSVLTVMNISMFL